MNSGRLTSLAMCAFVALVVACLVGSPRGERAVDCEGKEVASAIDATQAIPAHGALSLDESPAHRGAMFVDQPPPRSRLTIAEVFRPPQARS